MWPSVLFVRWGRGRLCQFLRFRKSSLRTPVPLRGPAALSVGGGGRGNFDDFLGGECAGETGGIEGANGFGDGTGFEHGARVFGPDLVAEESRALCLGDVPRHGECSALGMGGFDGDGFAAAEIVWLPDCDRFVLPSD